MTAFDAEARHTRIGVQTLNLFVERHQGENVVDSLLDREIGILKRILNRLGRLRHKRSKTNDQNQQATDVVHSKENGSVLIRGFTLDDFEVFFQWRVSQLIN